MSHLNRGDDRGKEKKKKIDSKVNETQIDYRGREAHLIGAKALLSCDIGQSGD